MQDITPTLQGLRRIEEFLQSQDPGPALLEDVNRLRDSLERVYFALGSTLGLSDSDLALQEILRKPTLPPATTYPPTFIMTHRRSGGTLLQWLLNAHPSIASVPENELLKGICGVRFQKPGWILGNLRSLEMIGEGRSVHLARYASLVDGVFSAYAARQGKARWVDKECFLQDCLDLVDAIFDYRAHYIFLVRHGLDVAFSASVADRYSPAAGPQTGQPSLTVERHLRNWAGFNRSVADFCSCNRDRCLLIRYEDLVDSPEPVAMKLFEYLGESWIHSLLDDMQSQSKPPGPGDYKIWKTGGRIHKDSCRHWEQWPADLLTRLGKTANPILSMFGYDPI
jgi:hypothetical protein